MLWVPSHEPAALPGVVTVDLVALAAPAGGKPAARASKPSPAPKPVPPAPKPAEAKPVPTPVAAPPPEPPKPPPPKPEPPKPTPPPRAEAVIPKTPEKEPEKPKAKPEPEPKPEPPKPEPQVAKAPPKPEPKPEPPAAQAPPPKPPAPKPAPKQESYDDLLADLRAERGESRPDKVERPSRTASAATQSAASGAGRPGAAASPEIAGWVRAVQIHVGQAWMLPPDMRGRKLMAELLVDLDARGRVLSEPRLVRSSGDARFDENAVRAIQKASPLPPPPDEGVWTIGFCPECRS